MKFKLSELRPILQALPPVLDKELPVKTAYWLARAFDQIQNEFKPFEQARMKLVERHAKRDKKGNIIVKNKQYIMKNQKLFEKEFAELSEQEIEIKYEPITIEQLGDAKFKPIELMELGRLIKEK